MKDKHRTIMKQPQGKGGRNGYHRLVNSVDTEKTSVYAFESDWIRPDVEVDLPVGGIIIRKTPTGSNRHPAATWAYATVPAQGEAWEWSEEYEANRFLTFRDDVYELHTAQSRQPKPGTGEIHLRERPEGPDTWTAFCSLSTTAEESVSYHSFRTLPLNTRFFCQGCIAGAATRP